MPFCNTRNRIWKLAKSEQGSLSSILDCKQKAFSAICFPRPALSQ